LWPLIVISKTELYTLPVGLAFFSGEFQTEWEMVMTGASVATIPVLIVFLIFQKQIIKGIALSGLKG
jgi:multiple sugar transport system permease protein